MATVDDRIRAALTAAAGQIPHRDPAEVLAAVAARRRLWPRRAAALAAAVVLVVAGVAVWRAREDSVEVESGPAAPGTGDTAPESGWTVVDSAPFPPAAAVWAGDRLAIWGAHGIADQPEWDAADIPDALAVWHPDEGWTQSPDAPMPASAGGVMVWTGHQVVVVDGGVAAAYSPDESAWEVLPATPAAVAARPVAAAWTGDEVVLWGDRDRESASRSGAAWDPARDRWRVLPEAPAPINQGGGTWADGQLVVVGAHLGPGNQPNTAVAAIAYSTATNSWSRLADPGLSPQASTAAAADGVVVAWDYLIDAVAYDRVADRWEPLPPPPFSEAECDPSSLAIPSRVVAFFCGGVAILDTRTRQWADAPPPSQVVPADAISGPAVWDGSRVLQVAGTPADLRLIALTPGPGPDATSAGPTTAPSPSTQGETVWMRTNQIDTDARRMEFVYAAGDCDTPPTIVVATSNGGHYVTVMLEECPPAFDGDVAAKEAAVILPPTELGSVDVAGPLECSDAIRWYEHVCDELRRETERLRHDPDRDVPLLPITKGY